MSDIDELSGGTHYHAVAARTALSHAGRNGKAAAYTAAAATIGTPGALDPTQRIIYLAVDGTDPYTLANPPDTTAIGTILSVICISGANTPNATVTPANTAGPAYTAVSAIGAAGDFCDFIWLGTGWATGNNAGVTRS